MTSNQFDEDYYITGNYDHYLTKFYQEGVEIVERLLSIVKLESEAKILDAGCGMGGVVMAFRDRGYKAIGTEISDYCIKNSPLKGCIQKIGVTSLPFEDNSFDLVVCQDVLYYLSHKQVFQAVNELVGVTRKYLYIEVISKGSPNSNQLINPDKLRKARNLMTKQSWLEIFIRQGLKPLCQVYSLEENPDFNYLFEKR